MTWKVILSSEFESWFLSLNDDAKIEILAVLNVLERMGPNLKRPYADSIKGSKVIPNLKELRVQCHGKPFRIFFAFNKNRAAVVLFGAQKKEKDFYKKAIQRTEAIWKRYLSSLT